MANRWHVEWLKEGVARWNKRRKRVDFSPDLSGVRFFEHLPKDFRDDPKTSRYFERLNLSDANLERADLSDLNFAGADFSGANLFGANLSKSNFRKASFARANLLEVNGARSIFSLAVFEDSKIEGVDFSESLFDGAIFIGTPLSSSQREEIGEQAIHSYESRSSFQKLTSTPPEHGIASGPKEGEDDRTKKTRYDVYYGTNRNPIHERGALVDFDGNKSSNLHFGLCEVIVPDSHRFGKIGSSLFKKLINKKSDALRIEGVIPLDVDLFWTHLVRTSDKMKIKARPTVFVHGYNTSFSEAVLRAAQIGHDLGIGQGIGLFSWPSKGKFLSYSADEASAEASKYDLANFLEGFVERGSNLGLNVIAHSMGCRVLLGAFEHLASKKSQALKEIHQVILAAADVDVNIMPYIGTHAIEHSERLTSYVSGKDKALLLSGWLHSFPRVGKTPPTFVIDGMDTVIVNEMDLGDFSHAYLASSRVILGDVYSILKNNLPPESRHSLVEVLGQPERYWRIRD